MTVRRAHRALHSFPTRRSSDLAHYNANLAPANDAILPEPPPDMPATRSSQTISDALHTATTMLTRSSASARLDAELLLEYVKIGRASCRERGDVADKTAAQEQN